MATRYWVGGAGTWNASSTTNWSATSGGAGGASAPTATDDVVIDTNSDPGTSYIITCAPGAICNLLTINSASGTSASLQGVLEVKGSITGGAYSRFENLILNLTPSANTGITLGSTTSAWGPNLTLNYNSNVTYSLSVSFSASRVTAPVTHNVNAGTITGSLGPANGSSNYLTVNGGTVTTSGGGFNNVQILSGSLTLNGALTCTTMTLSGGSLNKATYTLTCSVAFVCSGSTARSIDGTGSGATTSLSGDGNVFLCDDATNLTLLNPQTLSVGNANVTTKSLFGPTVGDSASNTFSFTVGSFSGTYDVYGAFLNATFTGTTTRTLANQTRKIYGNWASNVSGLTHTAGSLATTLAATSTGKTLSFGPSADFPLIFDGVGGGWTLEWTNVNTSAYSDITVTNGALTFSNITSDIKSLNSSNSNTRSITLPSSSTLKTSGATAIDFTNSTGLTLTPGTGTIACENDNQITFNGGGKTFANVSFSAASTNDPPNITTITGSNIFSGLSVSIRNSAGISQLVLGANQIVNGAVSISGASITTRTNYRLFVRSDQIGTQRTISGYSSVSAANTDFRDIALAGSAPGTGGRGDCGGNSNINASAAKTVYWVGTTSVWSDVTNGWSLTSGGTPSATYFPLPQDTAIIDNSSVNFGSTITVDYAYNLPNINASSCTQSWTLAGSVSNSIYGTLILNSQASVTYSGTLTFQQRGGTQTVTPNGVVLSSLGGIVAENIGGTVNLGSALTMTSKPLTVNYGTFAQTYNLTCGPVTVASTATAFTGTLSTAISCTNWTFPTAGPTLTLGLNHQLLFTGDFYGGNKSYRTVSPNSGGTGSIYDANTFELITAPLLGSTLRFEAGKTQTIGGITWGISVGSLVRYLRSTVPGSQFTWSVPSGTVFVGSTDIQDSNATGGATFQAYTSNKNVDSGNNTGWLFAAVVAAFLMLFGA